jgi:hypothetical protein
VSLLVWPTDGHAWWNIDWPLFSFGNTEYCRSVTFALLAGMIPSSTATFVNLKYHPTYVCGRNQLRKQNADVLGAGKSIQTVKETQKHQLPELTNTNYFPFFSCTTLVALAGCTFIL